MGQSVLIHKFKDGQTILPFEDNPEYARLIVAQHFSDLVTGDNGQTWLQEATRVAFIKGKTTQLEAKYGHLKYGQVFSKAYCVQKLESFEPFYTWTVTDPATGTVTEHTQEPKKKPANEAKGTKEETIYVDGKPVYMNFVLAKAGSEDVLIRASKEAVAPEDGDVVAETPASAPAVEPAEKEEDIAK
tara:strand:+ start:101 stop:661 length:561 start_codon:yes stop_codon:yes gene_type:complete